MDYPAVSENIKVSYNAPSSFLPFLDAVCKDAGTAGCFAEDLKNVQPYENG